MLIWKNSNSCSVSLIVVLVECKNVGNPFQVNADNWCACTPNWRHKHNNVPSFTKRAYGFHGFVLSALDSPLARGAAFNILMNEEALIVRIVRHTSSLAVEFLTMHAFTSAAKIQFPLVKVCLEGDFIICKIVWGHSLCISPNLLPNYILCINYSPAVCGNFKCIVALWFHVFSHIVSVNIIIYWTSNIFTRKIRIFLTWIVRCNFTKMSRSLHVTQEYLRNWASWRYKNLKWWTTWIIIVEYRCSME